MTMAVLRKKMIEEISQIPDEKLSELYDVIHIFRIGLETIDHEPTPKKDAQTILNAANGIYGLWKDREFDVDDYIRNLRKDRNI